MLESPLITPLALKPDFEEAKRRWLAFWEHEIIDRPCCVIRASKDGRQRTPGPAYMAGAREDFGSVIDQVLASAESLYWGGEAIPSYVPSFGPDQMAAWTGAELRFAEDDLHTSWAVPCIEDWERALPLRLGPENPWWQRFLGFLRALREACRGNLLITHVDLHSNMDLLLAMRGGQRLCTDLADVPETIDRAMSSARALYRPVYEGIYEAAGMGDGGTLGWVHAYHPVRTNTIQCDFAALIGPRHFRRWALPALEEEAAYLRHCVYHYDGPECLVHLDDICGIPGLDCIQWVHGARNRPFTEWMDLLKEIQSRRVAVWIPCNTQSIKVFHRELKPNLLFYDCWAPSPQAAEETLDWLRRNT
ncbi:MAG: hypothetical protein HY321_19400 [Armatimonadetes bacterium]|nr:hypothetical protein [Armatimonadota bacterium]